MGTENHLKADLNLLDGKLYVNPIKEKPRYIPRVKWECPPKFTLDPKWCVAAGEESREAVVQRDRLILLREDDPTHSAFRTSPSGPIYMNEYHDDSKTPLIPLSPIEEEEEANHPTDTTAPFWTAASSKSDQPKVPAIQGDMMATAAAGAAAALTSYLKRKDEGNVIDTDLLIQFLNNPKTVEKLINEHGGLSNAGSEHTSMQNEVTSSVPLPSSKPNRVMKTNINEHGVPANTGVNISGSKAVTPSISFLSAKPELEMMKSTHVPPTELATIPMSPPLSLPIGTTISEHSAPANTGVRISTPQIRAPFLPFPISKPELKILKLTDEHVPPPRAITIPIARSQLPPLCSVTDDLMLNKNLINDRAQPPLGSSQLTGPTPVAPFNDRRQRTPFESSQLTGSMPVAPLVPFPNSEPNGLKFKRLVNEYGASDRTRSQLMPGTRPVTPLVPFSFPKNMSVLPRANMQPTANALHHMRLLSLDVCQPPFLGGSAPAPAPAPMFGAKLMAPLFPKPSSRSDSFVWPMANPQLTDNGLQSTLHTRPLSSDVHPPPFLGGTAPPLPGTKLMEPFVPLPSPRTDMFVLPTANSQPTANVLQSELHRSPLPSAFVLSSPFVGANAPLMNHENYIKSRVRQLGGMQGTWDYGLHSLIGLLNNQIGKRELVQNINSSASMPKHQKPCIYFNCPRGCRNGSSCQYQHIMSDRPKPSGVSEPPPSAKKMKLDGVHGETSGRM